MVCWPRLLPLSQPGVRAVAKQAKLFVVHLVYWTGHVELQLFTECREFEEFLGQNDIK